MHTRNRRENYLLPLLCDVHPTDTNVVLEPLVEMLKSWWVSGIQLDDRRAYIGSTIFHCDMKGQASCLRLPDNPLWVL